MLSSRAKCDIKPKGKKERKEKKVRRKEKEYLLSD
jgi:hypothetical protein